MDGKELMYCYDPLCGWCYGFSPVVRQLEQTFSNQLPFTAYSGGMATGERAAPIGQAFAYIKQALGTVEQHTGVRFGQGFRDLLEEGSYVYNSEPPARALTVFKSVSNKSSLALAHALQQAIFDEGKNLNEAEVLAAIAEEQGLKSDIFLKLFEQEKYRQKTLEEFAFVQKMGVSGFPTLLYRNGRKLYILSRGYQAYEPLRESIEKLLQEGN
ncbi:MAG: DsbA family protein [Cyclobacteriaceae bacterium]